ncbi:CRAL-TRIO domain-containing protein [Mycotypha africana]|uniref:CRAL-TRIO domain-containing protein n=1 Tax=Mycotypha africana TaxID=64632 RepID=UPI00230165F4|nr:CRAL-TRIO domain-containing protein [Mycotypha africana]KAI8979617.1 CRAL-TRIO domain-containing protein [Mycotypha africana]
MGVPTTLEERQQLLDEFKQTLPPTVVKDLPEYLLLQCLDGNLWNFNDAKQQLLDTVEWRTKMGVDDLPVATKYNRLPVLMACRGYRHIEDTNFTVQPGISESTIRILNYVGGDCFHKFDKEGHPILIDRTGYHDAKHLGSHVTSEEITNYQVAANEFLNRVIMPEATEKAGQSIHSETIIFDCTHMSLRQFHMSAMYHLKAIADIVQHYYPETLHRLFVVNAPSAFVVMFKVIRPWLNPRTLEKIHVLGSDYQSVLLKYIDPENLPEFLGGQCQCKHMPGGCVPILPQKSSDKFQATADNEKVATVYNTDIMQAALKDKSLSSLLSEDEIKAMVGSSG